MNVGPYKDSAYEERMKEDVKDYPITEDDLHNMSASQGTPQIHAECEMIWTQVNQ